MSIKPSRTASVRIITPWPSKPRWRFDTCTWLRNTTTKIRACRRSYVNSKRRLNTRDTAAPRPAYRPRKQRPACSPKWNSPRMRRRTPPQSFWTVGTPNSSILLPSHPQLPPSFVRYHAVECTGIEHTPRPWRYDDADAETDRLETLDGHRDRRALVPVGARTGNAP